jgi:hypothetical protein
MAPSQCLHFLHVHVSTSRIPQTENGTNGKWQLLFVFSKRKRKPQTSVCLLLTEMGIGRFFFLVRQMININQRLLFQQTCPCMVVSYFSI